MKNETQKLLEKASHSLHSAEVLLKDGENEDAAGRAYYAMFHTAKAFLCEKDMTRFTKHGAVHGAFGKYFAKTGKLDPKFHRQLINTFNKRLQGDYDIHSNFSAEDVSVMIEQAQEFLKEARQYLI